MNEYLLYRFSKSLASCPGVKIAAMLALTLTSTAYALDDWLPLPSGQVDRIAFGSCAKQWEPQPIWNGIAAAEPDLFLFIGDAIYGDWHGEQPFTPTAESLRTDWAKLGAQPAFQAFRRQVPVLATWDNHDYGSHNGGAEFPLKEMARTEFLDFFGEPRESERRVKVRKHWWSNTFMVWEESVLSA
ncbi:MAG: hypothetical protein GY953_39005 [bacterium]|nr:hypothetical protein [bacterium]